MQNLPVYIINLPESADRRTYMTNQFAQMALEIPFQFFEAVHGVQNPHHPLFQKYQAQKHLRRKGRTLSLSELGCFASHYLVWQECVKHQQPMIVLEDDATLQPHFATFYPMAHSLAQQYHLLYLHQYAKSEAFCPIAHEGDFQIVRYLYKYTGTMGYLLHPIAAKKLLDYCQEWIYPVDDTMVRYYEHGLPTLTVYPFCCTGETEFDSTIAPQDGKRHALSLKHKLYREIYNLKDGIKRYWYNLRYPR